MTTKTMKELLEGLARTRQIFQSEGDFQHALARTMEQNGWTVRLEYPVRIEEKPVYVDIMAKRKKASSKVAIELKYKKADLDVTLDVLQWGEEKFALRDQFAQPIARYEFLRDVARLERMVAGQEDVSKGYAIFLSNNSLYWTAPRKLHPIDEKFRLQRDTIGPGVLKWQPSCKTSEGKPAIKFKKRYILQWRYYSELAIESPNREFKYLLIEV